MSSTNSQLIPERVNNSGLSPELINDAIQFLLQQVVHEPVIAQSDISLFEFRFSKRQEQKLNEIAQVLNLSIATTINSALCFAITYAARRDISLQATRGYPSRLGRLSFYSPITPKTMKRLAEAGIPEEEQLQFAAVLGIQLLHRRIFKIS